MKTQTCPIAASAELLGDHWNLLILREAFNGVTRFDGFRKALGIAPTILTKRLNQLTEHGILQKQRYSEHPPREEYLLTAAGEDLLPILLLLRQWASQHLAIEPPFALHHKASNQPLQLQVIDRASQQIIQQQDIIKVED